MQEQEITSEQLRAARGSLGLSVKDVAESTSIGHATIVRYEAQSGVPKSRKGHLQSLRSFYEDAGIEFIGTPDDRPGIRIGSPKT
jgi:transcriptional regulator with XRE-family HTH domain